MDTQTAESTQLNYYTNDVSNGAEHLAAVQPKTPTAVGEQQQFEIHSPVLPIMRGGRPSVSRCFLVLNSISLAYCYYLSYFYLN